MVGTKTSLNYSHALLNYSHALAPCKCSEVIFEHQKKYSENDLRQTKALMPLHDVILGILFFMLENDLRTLTGCEGARAVLFFMLKPPGELSLPDIFITGVLQSTSTVALIVNDSKDFYQMCQLLIH